MDEINLISWFEEQYNVHFIPDEETIGCKFSIPNKLILNRIVDDLVDVMDYDDDYLIRLEFNQTNTVLLPCIYLMKDILGKLYAASNGGGLQL